MHLTLIGDLKPGQEMEQSRGLSGTETSPSLIPGMTMPEDMIPKLPQLPQGRIGPVAQGASLLS